MADPSDHSRVTHYQVLNITPALLNSAHHDPSILIKRAYHHALLQNHPDKTTAAAAAAAKDSSSSPSGHACISYTIDQITNAFNVLSSPKDRAAYDASLRISGLGGGSGSEVVKFQTGVDDIDLDDLPFDEEKQSWYQDCRCGNERGYIFTEAELEEVGDGDELLVGCLDCSLWLRVHFSTIEE